MQNDALLPSSYSSNNDNDNDRNPKKMGRHLRLDKDPNLTLDFFWDLRKDRIPLFRALQLTKFITPNTPSSTCSTDIRARVPISTKDEDEDDEKSPESISTNTSSMSRSTISTISIAVDQVPSKLEVKNWLKDHPQSIRILTNNADDEDDCSKSSNNNITFQQLVSASSEQQQDDIYISRSAAAALLCSSLKKNYDDDCRTNLEPLETKMVGHPHDQQPPTTRSSPQEPPLLESSSWFRLGPRVPPQYALLYKRRGITCTCQRGGAGGPTTIGDVLDVIQTNVHHTHTHTHTHTNPVLIDPPSRMLLMRPLVHVGRLDLESEGLLLLTNDGTFSRLCTSPAVGLKKIYRVFCKSKGRRPWTKNSQYQAVDDNDDNEEEHSSLTILEEFQQRLYEITDKVQSRLLQEELALPPRTTGATTSSTMVQVKRRIPNQEPEPACSDWEFRAESCTIVDVRVENSCTAHMSHKSRGFTDGRGAEAANNNNNATSTVPTVLAVLDIEMRQGAKREVRRLLRSIDFVTLLLARTTIGELKWQSLVSTTDGAPPIWDFCVPNTIQEAQEKCLAYHTAQSSHHDDSDVLDRKRHIIDCSEAFRFLEKGEVDRMFASVDM
jgi:16S rRNA U516 pseudouridylate synthase RsuA-like enzyme